MMRPLSLSDLPHSGARPRELTEAVDVVAWRNRSTADLTAMGFRLVPAGQAGKQMTIVHAECRGWPDHWQHVAAGCNQSMVKHLNYDVDVSGMCPDLS